MKGPTTPTKTRGLSERLNLPPELRPSEVQAVLAAGAAWLRDYPDRFWRERAPSAWAEVDASNAPGLPRVELWDHKFDLTFRDAARTGICRVSPPEAERRVRDWARRLAALIDGHVLIAHLLALTDLERRIHVHGVLSFPPFRSATIADAHALWLQGEYPNGRAVVERYDQERGAIHYALLHGGLPVPRVACPPRTRCRKGLCGVSLGPWRTSEAVVFPGRAATRRLTS